MRALSLNCQFHHCKFYYLTRNSIPKWLKGNPSGNFKSSMETGMQLAELNNANYQRLLRCYSTEEFFKVLPSSNITAALKDDILKHRYDTLFIHQGGANEIAQQGVYNLCKEIESYIHQYIQQQTDSRPWKIFLASGTGITAYYAAQYFQQHAVDDIKVIALSCASSQEQLTTDLKCYHERHSRTDFNSLPSVISATQQSTREFADPCLEHYKIWQHLQQQTNLPFDLIYAPKAWEIMLEDNTKQQQQQKDTLKNYYPDHNLLYYHCGGMEGNPSQLQRYHRLKLI